MEYPEPTIDVKAQAARLLARAGGVAVATGCAGAGGGGGGAGGASAAGYGSNGSVGAGGAAGGGGGGETTGYSGVGVGAAGGAGGCGSSRDVEQQLAELLATAWEEGRWSPPGPVANPYRRPGVGLPAPRADQQGFPGLRLLRLRDAAVAALAWVENMAPTVRRTALAEQLRSALGGGGAA